MTKKMTIRKTAEVTSVVLNLDHVESWHLDGAFHHCTGNSLLWWQNIQYNFFLSAKPWGHGLSCGFQLDRTQWMRWDKLVSVFWVRTSILCWYTGLLMQWPDNWASPLLSFFTVEMTWSEFTNVKKSTKKWISLECQLWNYMFEKRVDELLDPVLSPAQPIGQLEVSIVKWNFKPGEFPVHTFICWFGLKINQRLRNLIPLSAIKSSTLLTNSYHT